MWLSSTDPVPGRGGVFPEPLDARPALPPRMTRASLAVFLQAAGVPWWKYMRQPVSVWRHKELRHTRRPWLSAK